MKKNLFAAFVALSVASLASADELPTKGTYIGVDQDQNPCSIELPQLRFGREEFVSSCYFEIDGEGPWCSTEKDVPVRSVKGKGSFKTEAGTETFKLDRQKVRFDGDAVVLYGETVGGGWVTMTFGGDHELVAYDSFVSDYGKTFSTEQRHDMLLSPDTNYSEVYDLLYTGITCTVN